MNLELNITLDCNQSCYNCNRMCNIYKNRTENMSLSQIDKFIGHCKEKPLQKVKVLGGEPLLHPQFLEIYHKLLKATEEGYIKLIKVNTNKTIKIPDLPKTEKVRWLGKKWIMKKHEPFLWHPKDLGYNIKPQYNCDTMKKCGISLDKYGYLPCSPAIMLVRLFNLTHLYRYEMPKEIWGLEEVCQHCIFGMPVDWRNEHRYSLEKMPEEAKKPTEMFRKAIADFSNELFYQTQREF